MEDPRDQQDNNEVLTEDSDDEYKDLLKEYEAKYAKLKAKKEQRKEPEVISDEEPAVAATNETLVPVKRTKPSSFTQNLYDANSTRPKSKEIDYHARKFAFAVRDKLQIQDIPCDEVDSISGQHLRKRFLKESVLKSIIHDTDPKMKFLTVDKFLAKVNRSNNYQEPSYNNWCFVGFVIKKFESKVTNKSTKFIKLKVGDFNRSVDIMLFDKAHEEYWKLGEGNAILVLNPTVQKYNFKAGGDRPKEIEGFNLKVDNFSLGSIIEYGSLRYYGTCTATRKSDNTKCSEVINTKKTTLCDFHVDQRFKSNQNRRMELNSGGGAQMRSPKNNRKSIFMNKNGSVAFTRNEYNEDTRVYHFQSSEDKSKYFNPKKLTAKVDKERKLKQEKANQALKEKLMANLANRGKLKSLNLIGSEVAPPPESGTFSSRMISEIGYDPTARVNASKNRDSSNKVMNELNALSSEKAKIRSLDTAESDVQLRKEKWKENFTASKAYNRRVMKRSIDKSDEEVRSKPMVPERYKKSRILEDGLDSDSDIEIEFDTKEMEQAYKNRMSK